MSTGIEWTDETWNPVVGCSRVSAGCKNCYAFHLHDMRHKAVEGGADLPLQYAFPFTTIQLMEPRLGQPLRWCRPRRIFVNSMSDLFHDRVPDSYIAQVFGVMAFARRHGHIFQILTKRADRMLKWFQGHGIDQCIKAIEDLDRENRERWIESGDEKPRFDLKLESAIVEWPLSHVHLGVSVEDQRAADERIPQLLQTPAAVRFISGEPLLGPVEFSNVTKRIDAVHQLGKRALSGIDWVIVGGESGPGARPMHPDWARSLRDQCQAAGVPFFFKQWGEWEIASVENGHQGSVMPESNKKYTWVGNNGKTFNPSAPNGLDCYAMARVGKKKAGRLLDGREWNEFPGRPA